ncbi:MAG: GNAT family N-acetyltransferase [Hyphomicrobiales bacterium]|nr:GNAT family N-acetyltransferase [Hyphomicrobiales bacterium]
MAAETFPIETERLILRRWRDDDRGPFAAMCADPAVMEFLTPQPTRADSDGYIDRLIAHQVQHGFTFWAMEERTTGAFAGMTGLRYVPFEAHFTPAVEFGWRMPVANWGKGFVTEAALACRDYGFQHLKLDEIVAFASERNMRSRAVMPRIGMTHDPEDDFYHPRLPRDHPVQPLILYRIKNPAMAEKGKPS